MATRQVKKNDSSTSRRAQELILGSMDVVQHPEGTENAFDTTSKITPIRLHPPHLPPPATHTTMTNQPDLTFASFVLVLDAEATGSQERRRLVPAGVGGTRARADPSSIGGLGELRIYSPLLSWHVCAKYKPSSSHAPLRLLTATPQPRLISHSA